MDTLDTLAAFTGLLSFSKMLMHVPPIHGRQITNQAANTPPEHPLDARKDVVRCRSQQTIKALQATLGTLSDNLSLGNSSPVQHSPHRTATAAQRCSPDPCMTHSWV
jgi:hypothetical protein